MQRLTLILPLLLTACAGDETVSGYADPGAVYQLEELNGKAFAPRATIAFPEQGQVAGEGPCNRYAATQGVPYPWIALGPIVVTKRACADLAAEDAFLAALGAASLVEVQGDVVILTNDAGLQMVFRAQD